MSLRGLAKSYGDKRAVNALDLDVPVGSFFGLVGPNGGGQEHNAADGDGFAAPRCRHRHGVRSRRVGRPIKSKAQVGVLTEDLRLFDRLSAEELLSYNGLLRSMARDVIKQRSDELLDVLGLEDDRGTFVIDFSQGMRKKITLASRCCTRRRCCSSTSPSSR